MHSCAGGGNSTLFCLQDGTRSRTTCGTRTGVGAGLPLKRIRVTIGTEVAVRTPDSLPLYSGGTLRSEAYYGLGLGIPLLRESLSPAPTRRRRHDP